LAEQLAHFSGAAIVRPHASGPTAETQHISSNTRQRTGSKIPENERETDLQILEADLQVQLAGAGNDVLARLLDGDLDHGVGLGQPLQALHQLGQVLRVLRTGHKRKHVSTRLQTRISYCELLFVAKLRGYSQISADNGACPRSSTTDSQWYRASACSKIAHCT